MSKPRRCPIRHWWKDLGNSCLPRTHCCWLVDFPLLTLILRLSWMSVLQRIRPLRCWRFNIRISRVNLVLEELLNEGQMLRCMREMGRLSTVLKVSGFSAICPIQLGWQFGTLFGGRGMGPMKCSFWETSRSLPDTLHSPGYSGSLVHYRLCQLSLHFLATLGK